jgi:ATP/maltotriose-dependent transcriptional regulator MalT
MWHKLRKLIPPHLRYLFDKENNSEVDQPRKFDFKTTGFHAIKSVEMIEREEQNNHYMELWETLSFREQEIVALICRGYRNHQIAAALGLAHGTVKKHLDNIFDKLDLHDRRDIKSAFKDWDLRAWWETRHISPTPMPYIRI